MPLDLEKISTPNIKELFKNFCHNGDGKVAEGVAEGKVLDLKKTFNS